jgi:hypothetical protein
MLSFTVPAAYTIAKKKKFIFLFHCASSIYNSKEKKIFFCFTVPAAYTIAKKKKFI